LVLIVAKRMKVMSDLRRLVGIRPNDRDNVKATALMQQSTTGRESSCQLDQLATFIAVNRSLGATAGPLQCFDLDIHDDLAIESDQVQFAIRRGITVADNTITQSLQISSRSQLAAIA